MLRPPFRCWTRAALLFVGGATLWVGCSASSGGADGGGRADGGGGRRDGAYDVRDLAMDRFVPFSLALTVDEIPQAMNGSRSFTDKDGKTRSFTLVVPRHGFSIDVSWRGSLARPSTLKVTADRPLGSGSAQVAAGSDLSSRFRRRVGTATLLVPSSLALPAGGVTLTASLAEGASTRTASLQIKAADKTFMLDPFRLTDRWLIVFSRDDYAIKKRRDSNGAWRIESRAGKNGLPDFDEDLRAVGLGSAKMRSDAAAVENLGVKGTNAIVVEWIQREALAALRGVFGRKSAKSAGAGAVDIRFFREGDSGAPKLADFADQTLSGGETKRAFSAISVGGGDLSRKLLGLSRTVDLRNVRNEANIGPAYGVFTTTALATVAAAAASSSSVRQLAQLLLGQFVPELGQNGTPVGQSALDAKILAKGFDSDKASGAAATRYRKLAFVVETLGRLVGALTAHEIGHALGLVAGGPPPHGLFGGERRASFVQSARTTPGHIDTSGFNIMEAGPGSAPAASIDVSKYLTVPRFNAINLAYLRGRLLLLPAP